MRPALLFLLLSGSLCGFDATADARRLNDLGIAYRAQGRCLDAIDVLAKAMRIWKAEGMPEGPSRITGVQLLTAELECGEAGRAESFWKRDLAPLAERLGDGGDAAALWSAGALAEAGRKRYTESTALYTRAIRIWQQDAAGNRDRLAVARANRGVARAHAGAMKDAAADAEAALELLPAGLAPALRAATINNAGLVFLMARQFDRAAECLDRARAALRQAPDCTCTPAILANYALLLRETGRPQEAKRAEREAAEAARQLGAAASGPTVDVKSFSTPRPRYSGGR